jgi:hypothetical protein
LDGKTKALGFQPCDTVTDVLDRMAEKIGLQSLDGWALYEVGIMEVVIIHIRKPVLYWQTQEDTLPGNWMWIASRILQHGNLPSVFLQRYSLIEKALMECIAGGIFPLLWIPSKIIFIKLR